jgi:hypothetical protein
MLSTTVSVLTLPVAASRNWSLLLLAPLDRHPEQSRLAGSLGVVEVCAAGEGQRGRAAGPGDLDHLPPAHGDLPDLRAAGAI